MIAASVILGISALMIIPVRMLYLQLEHRENAQQAEPSSTSRPAAVQTPEPRLEPIIGQTLAEVRKHENEVLGSYGWVDRSGGVVRIPIERALELVAREGLPARAGAQPYHRFSPQERGTKGAGGSNSRAISHDGDVLDGNAAGASPAAPAGSE